MKIYKLYLDTQKFTFVHLVEKSQRWSSYTFEAFKKNNDILKLEKTNREKKNLPISDFSSLGRNFPFCFNENVYELLKDVLSRCGIIKAANLKGIDSSCFIFWPSYIVDCMDEENSEIFETITGFKQLVKPVFYTDKLPSKSIFITPQFMTSDLFVTEDVAEILKNSEITGYILVDASIPRTELRG